MKKIVIWLITFSILLTGCYKSWLGKRPCDQPNSKWMSEDQSTYFEMDESGNGTGYLLLNGETVEFLFMCDIATKIMLYAPEAIDRLGLYPEETYEIWSGSFDQADSFTATVKQTTFFSVGQELKFYRIDDPES
jgi:hypothetical protein